MKIVEIDNDTEGTFFRCLHDEKPQDPEIARIRKEWYAKMKPLGLRAKVLIEDNGDVVGLCQYLPIEHSPFEGKDMLAILCMWIHGYEHLIGNQQGKGYGRFFLEHVEEDAKKSGFKGVAVWGKDFPYWNPVSFYEHMGYSRADKDGNNVLVWKVWEDSVEVPKIKHITLPEPTSEDKVNITAFLCGWCIGEIEGALETQEVVKGIEDIACSCIVDNSSSPTIDGTVYLDDETYRPDGPPYTIEEFKEDIIKMHKEKNQ
ncbi:MAG: GNAT family N-acetyltransferase [Promethearchaeota archaeon]